MNPVRNTHQRKLILSVLAKTHSHPTAEEIYELARREDAHIGRGTVYRNLNFLLKKGLIRRLAVPDGPVHYEYALHHHYHFFCRKCQQLTDADLPYQEAFNKDAEGLPGHRIEQHQLLLIGLCPNCRD